MTNTTAAMYAAAARVPLHALPANEKLSTAQTAAYTGLAASTLRKYRRTTYTRKHGPPWHRPRGLDFGTRYGYYLAGEVLEYMKATGKAAPDLQPGAAPVTTTRMHTANCTVDRTGSQTDRSAA